MLIFGSPVSEREVSARGHRRAWGAGCGGDSRAALRAERARSSRQDPQRKGGVWKFKAPYRIRGFGGVARVCSIEEHEFVKEPLADGVLHKRRDSVTSVPLR